MMMRPTTTTEIPPTVKDISNITVKPSSPKTRRTPSFLFDSPPSAPLAPTTSIATATSTTKSKKDTIPLSNSARKSFFPSPTKSSFSSGNSGGSSGFAGGIFSLSSLLARMPSTASILPILSSSSHRDGNSRKMGGGSNGNSSKDKASTFAELTTAEKQDAVRNAKATVASLRNDWDWAEELRKNKRRRTEEPIPTEESTALSEDEDSEDEDEREYRSREESDSEDSKPTSSSKSGKSKEVYPDDEPKSVYRFHGPDAIGAEHSKEDRKTRRKNELEEEMKWNEGLRIWVERRDLWTQANKEGKVPIGKSKFEDNPFYEAIVPDAYPQLYQRIIIKSNTPTIPINLQHMTNALVEGWKADGQWPPKPVKPEPSFSRKKSIGVGESMVKRVFGIGR